MKILSYSPNPNSALELSRFKEMDYFAVENYDLPIELMMENAGLQLANLVAHVVGSKDSAILIGIGNGNNGGGGLVAARRLAAWGFKVSLDLGTDITKDLPRRQLDRALKFGVSTTPANSPDVWVDAYLGFSQRLPLRANYLDRVERANAADCFRISLDIPTGFLGETTVPYFKADKVMTLAAPKRILQKLPTTIEVYIADLGIPRSVYERFGVSIPPFAGSNLLVLE